MNEIFLKYSDKLKRNQSVIGKRQREVLASRLEQYAKDNIYYLQPYVLSDDKKRIKQLAKELQQFILTKSRKLRLEIRKTKGWEDNIPRVPRFHSLKLKRWLWIDEDKISKVAVIPNPSVIPVNFVVGGVLPELPPNRNGFEIGKTVPSSKPYMLELEDLYRHGYIIGGTGAGKTTTIISLITSIRKAYNNAIIMIFDPHGDMAEEVASYFADNENLIYFHPVEAPLSINPLALPNLPNKEQALLLGFSNVMEIFEKLFGLKDTAVYVKYIIQVSMQLLYSKTPEPTFRDLYRIIYKLRTGEIDLPVDDPTWESKLEMFQNMQEQSFLSAISRLEMLGTNPLLLKIFSKTKIDDNELFKPGNIIVINASKAAVGNDASFLILAGWIFKTWYYALARAALNMERIPIIAFMDEFQNIASLSVIDDILSEARKYAMHIIMAHQHTGQLDMSLIKSIMSNTGVKMLMKEQGDDAKAFAKIFPDFGSELEKTLPGLGVGEAVVIITPRKEGDKVVPVRVKINYVPTKKDPEKLKKVIERMQKYATGEVPKNEDIESIVNPIMKYIEKPQVLEQLVLYHIFKNGKKMYLVDLLKELGLDRDKVNDVVNKLEKLGYIDVEKEGNKKVLYYGKGLFGNVKAAAPSQEGRKLAMKVMLRYMKQGYYVAPAKQSQELSSRPDLVAIPIDKSSLRPLYDRAIAIEIESCNELSVHPEQVVRNWRKESVKDFTEVHSWTYAECFDKLQQLYNQLSDEEKKKVKIFALKVREKTVQKVEEKTEETQKESQSTGEFTSKGPEQSETKAVTSATNNNNIKGPETLTGGLTANENKQQTITQTNAATDNTIASNAQSNDGKLGSLQGDGAIVLSLQGRIIRINKTKSTIEIDGEEYKVPSFELRAIINRKDSIIAVSKKEKKIIVAYDNGVTSEIGIIS
ncbi:type IV secretion system DNA-binding domain-containing protein [Sulfuracidifex tepidarius]|uniref:Uncharacterized protein n=1 Tax=Sulfuracidifex tepidarius TaxID=1294262 RepID=A0A510E484_9CREN|nr:type IV secretion system DNA-binding domain-containing protein [Sulfuracidifex tepidarius]BBG24113.1 hypothetical protein IC006_1415 [Sulfuracidifex tepidarius]BBG26868.1 hypothetical protein IC007_1390 [Sulfuracidifex tepidarius]